MRRLLPRLPDEHIGELWDDVRTSGWLVSELVAGVGGEVVGHVGLSHAWLDRPKQTCQVALLDSDQPWMTGRVVYPDVWWRQDAAGLRDPDLARLEDYFARTCVRTGLD